MESGIEYFDYDLIKEEPISTKYAAPVGENYVDATDEEIVDRMGKLIENIRAYTELVVNALVAYEQVVVSKAFYSNDRQLEQVYTYSTAYQVTYVMRDETLKYAFASESGMMGFERFNVFEKNYKKYVDEAIEMLDLKPVKEGEYDVICNPTVSG